MKTEKSKMPSEQKFLIYKKYPSTRKSINKLEDLLVQLKQDINLSELEYFNMHICIYEIFINAIYHGNKIDPTKYVELLIDARSNHIQVMVIDQGIGFIVEEVANPLARENLLKDCGRGIFIVNNYVKSLEYKFIPRGFCASLTFDLNNATEASQHAHSA